MDLSQKSGVFPVTNLFFENFVSVYERLIKSCFVVPKTQMPIFVLSVCAGVLIDGAFFLWLSLNRRGGAAL